MALTAKSDQESRVAKIAKLAENAKMGKKA